jgi:hypothetical protein
VSNRTVHCRSCNLDLPVGEFRIGRIRPATKRDQCKKCGSRASRAWNLANPDRVQKSKATHAPKHVESAREWRSRSRAHLTEYARRWREKNRASVNARATRRKCASAAAISLRGSRIVAWADHEAIKVIYEGARRISRELGIPHEVDHIIPLKGINVCGLHVEYNLRVVPASVNRRKARSFEEVCHFEPIL